MSENKVELIGYASGIAGVFQGSAKGPEVLQKSSYNAILHAANIHYHWNEILLCPEDKSKKLASVTDCCKKLANLVKTIKEQKNFFTVLGGDHTSAIGTWSGVSTVNQNKPIGMIWVDAHMDSHTPETTPSGNIHGMPLACLLGFGYPELTSVGFYGPKINPAHLCLIGVRSFEKGEAELLERLNVRIFFIEEVKRKGLDVVMQEAINLAQQNPLGYGLSIDIDCLDPEDAPGTGVTESGGILAKDLLHSLTFLANDPKLLGVEIAEFDPQRDKDHITEKLIFRLLGTLLTGKIL